MVRQDDTLCFPNAQEDALASGRNDAYYDSTSIGQISVKCSKTVEDVFNAENTASDLFFPDKNYRYIYELNDSFLINGFSEYSTLEPSPSA